VKEEENTWDQCHSSTKTTKQTGDIVTSFPVAVENDQQMTVHDLPLGTVHAILTDNLGLVNKSAHWVPKLLSTAGKGASGLQWILLGPLLASLVTMDKLAVSFHTPETKKQFMQWVKKPQKSLSQCDKDQENGPSLL
jgi:hypothetical protein